MTLNLQLILTLAALVLFIAAAIIAFTGGGISVLGLIAAGLACLTVSNFPIT